ncbi:hypothetical protein [Wenxinia marina]|uniref:Uncharacterized protein n=1 Tax=Wenxinia marina DSM 24838 TaxID=1123501 RepID=A0A0D0QBS8_9RHOB|nr:hypothetical protein [Wenxinia marina]KIQ68413.1 hypothetical protein Wenmar_03060 [Wenxinia marina DSM 24838]GGL72418.1 hypothetical protein GCM10011392_28760 [Wenxinia marina]
MKHAAALLAVLAVIILSVTFYARGYPGALGLGLIAIGAAAIFAGLNTPMRDEEDVAEEEVRPIRAMARFDGNAAPRRARMRRLDMMSRRRAAQERARGQPRRESA